MLDQLDAKMAIGESRRAAKARRRSDDPSAWTVSTGQMHAYTTRSTYQQQALAFANWSREQAGIKRWQDLEEQAEELVSTYLHEQRIAGRSPYTLATQRSALRLLFGEPTLAQGVVIPRRQRALISRSRGPAVRDQTFQPANWQPLISFLQATGLRRAEVAQVRVGDIVVAAAITGRPEVSIRPGVGKGGRPRIVPVLPGKERAVLALVEGRVPDERIFARLPSHLDIHALRRQYAQAYYLYLSGRTLPPTTGRLTPDAYDRAAVLQVSHALGHNRIDVILRHYLR